MIRMYLLTYADTEEFPVALDQFGRIDIKVFSNLKQIVIYSDKVLTYKNFTDVQKRVFQDLTDVTEANVELIRPV